jgi:hypothetical protein
MTCGECLQYFRTNGVDRLMSSHDQQRRNSDFTNQSRLFHWKNDGSMTPPRPRLVSPRPQRHTETLNGRQMVGKILKLKKFVDTTSVNIQHQRFADTTSVNIQRQRTRSLSATNLQPKINLPAIDHSAHGAVKLPSLRSIMSVIPELCYPPVSRQRSLSLDTSQRVYYRRQF